MGLKFSRSQNATDLITVNNPLVITQKGDILNNDANKTPIDTKVKTVIYLFNDGRRYDPVFDPPEGTAMPGKLAYRNITVKPKGITFSLLETISASSTKIKVSSEAQKVGVGSIVRATKDTQFEDMLVKKVYFDTDNFWKIEVVRGINGTTALSLDSATFTVDVSHIRLSLTDASLTNDTAWSSSVIPPDITTDVLADTTNLFTPIYVRAEVVASSLIDIYKNLNIYKIPTQVRYDVYFEVTADEYPR